MDWVVYSFNCSNSCDFVTHSWNYGEILMFIFKTSIYDEAYDPCVMLLKDLESLEKECHDWSNLPPVDEIMAAVKRKGSYYKKSEEDDIYLKISTVTEEQMAKKYPDYKEFLKG
jgi:hypothetical protein